MVLEGFLEATFIASIINSRTIGFFFRLALVFEPLAPTGINFYLSRTLGDLKKQGSMKSPGRTKFNTCRRPSGSAL